MSAAETRRAASPPGRFTSCPFCTLPESRIVGRSKLSITVRDGYPVSPGHTLLIPNRHVADWFDLTAEEVADLLTAAHHAKVALDSEIHPDAYNLGVNAGVAAGQTVMHVHLHLIPRFVGDTRDPRGGIRHCIPHHGYHHSRHPPKVSPPTEQRQIEILLKLQRLLSEGMFVASYKYALLLAIADLAVERGDDSGAPLPLPLTAIAEQFIRIYWRQARDYVPRRSRAEAAAGPLLAAEAPPTYGSTSAVLRQSSGTQAAILNDILEVFTPKQGSLAELRRDAKAWTRLVKSVATTVEKMPLWKLQTIGDSNDEFLYDNHRDARVTSIELKAGVAFTLRRFHGFIEELVRGNWARFVAGLRQNKAILGEAEDLYAFLFGTERASLEQYVPILLDVQDGVCFYCQGTLARKSGHVDHFIPWVRYPVDLAHNFVLAHGACNEAKSNVLAACDHLERWALRNLDHAKTLDSEFGARNSSMISTPPEPSPDGRMRSQSRAGRRCGNRSGLDLLISTRDGVNFPDFRPNREMITMEYRSLGRTGVQVSQICLGTMMFGQKTDKADSIRIIDHALGRGLNFVDTANVYAGNESERIVGEALAADGKRQNVILATKFHFPQGKDVNARGLSRRHLIEACDASLKRLRTDWIDLYQLHRSSADIPIDETLRALDDLIRAGKVRYIGCSMFPSWRIVEALWVAKELGLNRFVSEQPAYHMLDRTAEREVIPAAQSFGLAIIPWGPLCGGLLTGKYRRDQGDPQGRWQGGKDNFDREATPLAWDVIDLLRTIAEEKRCSVSQVALAWCAAQPGVTAPIIGPRTFEQVEDNLGAANVRLDPADFARIDGLVPPRSVALRYYDHAVGTDFRPHSHRSVV